MNGGSCCLYGWVSEVYMEVCLPKPLAHEIGWKDQVVTAILEEKEEGEGPDPEKLFFLI